MYNFLVNYTGSKYHELKDFFFENSEIIEEIKNKKYKKIIEPYGGTFGFIRVLNHVYNLENVKYEVYDINQDLINLYLYIQNLSLDEYIKFIDDYNKKIKLIRENCMMSNDKHIDNKKFNEFIKTIDFINTHQDFLLKNNVCRGAFSSAYCKKIEEEDFYLIKKIKFILGSCDVKPEKETLYYFDPPYISSSKINNYNCDYLVDNKTIHETIKNLVESNNINFIFNHETNFLLDIAFKQCKKIEYSKLYYFTKKRCMTSFFYIFGD